MLSTLLADIDPTSAPYRVGQALPFVIFGILVLKAFAISRRPHASPRAAWGLLLVCLAWVLGVAAGFMTKMDVAYRAAGTILAILAFIVLIVGLVLAVFGLIESRRNRERFTQGTTQAVWACILGLIMLAVVSTAVVRAVSRNLQAQMPMSMATNGVVQKSIPFDDLNFTFDTPDRPWVRIDAQRINIASCLGFARGVPQMTFLIIAERLGVDETNDSLAEMAINKLKTSSEDCQVIERQPETINGLDGIRLITHAQLQGVQYVYASWLCAHNGYLYQLVGVGLNGDDAAIRSEGEQLWQHFHLIDPTRHATASTPVGDTLTNLHSDDFGVSMDVTGQEWHRSTQLAKIAPAALFGGDRTQATFFSLFAYQLGDLNPPVDYLARAFLEMHRMSYSDATNIRDSSVGSFDSTTFELNYTRQGIKHWGYYTIIRRPGFAYALQSDTIDPNELPRLAALPEAIHPDPDFVGLAVLGGKYNDSHKLLFNAIGIQYENSKQFADAARYFSKAFDYSPDTTVLNNLIGANEAAGNYLDALVGVNRGLQTWPDQVALLAQRAKLQVLLNNPAAAVNAYRSLFATDYRDDDSFHQYLLLLEKQNKVDDALTAAAGYLAKFDTEPVAIDQALLYDKKGQHDLALESLHKLHQANPSNVIIATDLATVMLHAKQYSQAVDVAQELITAGNGDAVVYALLGEGQFGLGWYRQAKDSFETALRKSPDEPILQKWIDITSAKLGEGDNSTIKSPIDPVQLPPSLLTDAGHATPPPDPTQDAWYIRHIQAVSFAPSDHMKTSEYQLVKVFNQRGVDSFSKLDFSFDSLSEKIYLNKLEVRDENGKLVATTDASHCFVTDQNQAQSHSFRKQLNVPVEGLKANYTLECVVTKTDISPPAQVEFTFDLLGAAFPGSYGAVYLTGKTDAVKSVQSAGIAPQEIGDGLCWSVSPLPQYRNESQQPLADAFLPYVALGPKSTTWEGIAKDYLATISPLLAPDPAAAAVAAQLTQGLSTDAQKLAAILKYVQHDYTYTAIEFGRRARIPDKAADIIHNKFGDCKDHALLLMQLLQSASIPAQLALANFDQTIEPALPSLDQFTHMIVYVPSMKPDGFFDCTDKLSDIHSGVPMGLGKHTVLLLDPAAPKLMQVPEYPADSHIIHCDRTVSFADKGDLSIVEDVSLQGPEAADFRYFFDAIAPGERVNQMQEFLAGRGAEVVLHDLQISNLDDAAQPLDIKLAFSVSNCFSTLSNQMVGTAPALLARYFLGVAPVEHRLTPFEYRYPLRLTLTSRLILPEGYHVAAPPGENKISDPYTSATAQYTSAPAGFTTTLSFQSQPFVHPVGDYAAFEQSRTNLLEAIEPRLDLVK